jgi:HEPN domain-containing protein
MAETHTGFLYAASKDISAINTLSEDGVGNHCEVISFLAQQAAEKIVKNIYMTNNTIPSKIHDIGELLQQAINNGWLKATQEELQAAIDLTTYAVLARYETSPDISAGEAEHAIQSLNVLAGMADRNDYLSMKANDSKEE